MPSLITSVNGTLKQAVTGVAEIDDFGEDDLLMLLFNARHQQINLDHRRVCSRFVDRQRNGLFGSSWIANEELAAEDRVDERDDK